MLKKGRGLSFARGVRSQGASEIRFLKLLEEWPDTGTTQVEALRITLKFRYLFLALSTVPYLHDIVFVSAPFFH